MRLFVLYTAIFSLVSCGGNDSSSSSSNKTSFEPNLNCQPTDDTLQLVEQNISNGNTKLGSANGKQNLFLRIESGSVDLLNDVDIGTLCIAMQNGSLHISPLAKIDNIQIAIDNGRIDLPDFLENETSSTIDNGNVQFYETLELSVDSSSPSISSEYEFIEISASSASVTISNNVGYLLVSGDDNDVYFPEGVSEYELEFIHLTGDNNVIYHSTGSTLIFDLDEGQGNSSSASL